MTAHVYRPDHPEADAFGMVPKHLAGPLHQTHGDASYFMPDIAAFVAPGHVPITSRSALREYEKRTGTRQCGELKTAADFASAPPPGASTLDTRAFDAAFRQAAERVFGT